MNTRKFLSALLLPLVLVLFVSSVYGGSENRTGTAGAVELMIPVGSRGAALSGAGNSMMTGVEALHWNPAGLSRNLGASSGVEAMFSSLNWLADIQLNYFAVGVQVGEANALGLSLRTLDFGDIQETTVQNPEGTGGTFSPNYITLGLSFSRAFTDRIYGGVTMKLISEKILRTTATGIGMDFGVQYVSSVGLKLGVALKNLGPEMKFDGEDMENFVSLPYQEPGSRDRAVRLTGGQFDLPSTLEIGIAYDYSFAEDNIVTIMGNFQNANFGADEFRVGLEYSWNNQLFLRGGYMRLGQNDKENNIYGPSVGGGVMLPIGGTNVSFDYAYRTADFFSANQWFTLKVGF
ncbi:MAG: PorV/PorQ family protein [Ignavibacteriae bacterium]|nr:PorV/PorQ family protein [Ignavibacteriota bacterium]